MKFSLLLFSLAVAATIVPHVHGAYRYSSPNAFYFDKDLATVDSYGSSLPWDVLSAKTDDKAEVDLTFRVLKCSQHLGPKIFLRSPKILVVTKGCLLVEIAEENSRPFTGEPSFSFMLKPGQTGYVPQGLPHIEKSVDCGYGHYNDTEYYTYFPKRKHSVKILDALKDFEKLMVVSAFNSKYEDVETVLAA